MLCLLLRNKLKYKTLTGRSLNVLRENPVLCQHCYNCQQEINWPVPTIFIGTVTAMDNFLLFYLLGCSSIGVTVPLICIFLGCTTTLFYLLGCSSIGVIVPLICIFFGCTITLFYLLGCSSFGVIVPLICIFLGCTITLFYLLGCSSFGVTVPLICMFLGCTISLFLIVGLFQYWCNCTIDMYVSWLYY